MFSLGSALLALALQEWSTKKASHIIRQMHISAKKEVWNCHCWNDVTWQEINCTKKIRPLFFQEVIMIPETCAHINYRKKENVHSVCLRSKNMKRFPRMHIDCSALLFTQNLITFKKSVVSFCSRTLNNGILRFCLLLLLSEFLRLLL